MPDTEKKKKTHIILRDTCQNGLINKARGK